MDTSQFLESISLVILTLIVAQTIDNLSKNGNQNSVRNDLFAVERRKCLERRSKKGMLLASSSSVNFSPIVFLH